MKDIFDSLSYSAVPMEWSRNSPAAAFLFRITKHPDWQRTLYGEENDGPLLHAFACWDLVETYFSARHSGTAFLSVFKAHPEQVFYYEKGAESGLWSQNLSEIAEFDSAEHYETKLDQRNEYLGTHVLQLQIAKKLFFKIPHLLVSNELTDAQKIQLAQNIEGGKKEMGRRLPELKYE